MQYKHVTDYGGSGEVVILLHGFVSSSRYWRRIQPKLSRAGYRVITIDLLGFGAAPKPQDAGYSYNDHIKHIDLAVAKLGITKPFLVIGHSMGALLAIRYGLLYSHKVKSLILLHPPLYKNKNQVRMTLRSTGRFYRVLLESRHRKYAWAALASIGLLGKHSSYSREGSMLNVIEKAEMLDDLKIAKQNTLLLMGTRDRKEYMSNLSNLSLSPKVKVVTENVSHHSPRLRPNLIYRHIREFIYHS